ncbi:MAG: 5'-3' exonuclease [Verrucomicrobia bacterium]|jgi:DNA polymerase-1|nr:5'-3' exonuclease [Verrucomicrobiota bacterium]
MRYALLDGYNLAFRAFYGMPELTRADGFPTGALHGWVRTLWWVEDHVRADENLVFFDLGGASRQTALREDYKANRTETPEALEQQMPPIKEWTRAAGYRGIERDGVEADDLIAAYARRLAAEGHDVRIVSADKDLGQLVTDRIHQLLPPPTANPKIGWRELDPAEVEKKFGIRPDQIADYLAIVGDTSDNIPGLKGVGPKTAAKWLNQFGSLEEILAHSGELQPKRFQQLVHAEAENLRLNRRMTLLEDDHDTEDPGVTGKDPERALALLREMEMGRTAETYAERIG